jgi:hypothetical protein
MANVSMQVLMTEVGILSSGENLFVKRRWRHIGEHIRSVPDIDYEWIAIATT